MNKTMLLGRLTADPELRYTNTNNIPVVSFTLAVRRKFTREGGPEADFINIVAWQKTAEFVAEYFTKGQLMALEGRFENHNWTDRDGIKRYDIRVVAESVDFAGYNKGDVQADNAGEEQVIDPYADLRDAA